MVSKNLKLELYHEELKNRVYDLSKSLEVCLCAKFRWADGFNYNYILPSQGIAPEVNESTSYDWVGSFMVFGFPNQQHTAYNLNDAGQFVWGRAMSILGFKLNSAFWAANRSSQKYHRTGRLSSRSKCNWARVYLPTTNNESRQWDNIQYISHNFMRENREEGGLLRKTDRGAIRL